MIPSLSPQPQSDRSAPSKESQPQTLLGRRVRFVCAVRGARLRTLLRSELTRLFLQDSPESAPVRLPGSLPRSLLRDLHAFHVINVFRGQSFFRRWRRFRPWSHRQL